MFISRWASLSSWMGRPKQIVIHFNKEPRVNSEPTTHDCKRKKSIHSFRANRHTIIYNCSGRKFGCCLPINLWLCDSSFGYFGTFSSLRSQWSRWRGGGGVEDCVREPKKENQSKLAIASAYSISTQHIGWKFFGIVLKLLASITGKCSSSL